MSQHQRCLIIGAVRRVFCEPAQARPTHAPNAEERRSIAINSVNHRACCSSTRGSQDAFQAAQWYYSSTWVKLVSEKSKVSRRNHCRSDPVRVQSTESGRALGQPLAQVQWAGRVFTQYGRSGSLLYVGVCVCVCVCVFYLRLLPRRVCCAQRSARLGQHAQAPEQAQGDTAPIKNSCDKQVSSWRHISCHTDKNRYYT